jgi:hypothetical protein
MIVGVPQAFDDDELGVVGKSQLVGDRCVDGRSETQDIASRCRALCGNGIEEG